MSCNPDWFFPAMVLMRLKSGIEQGQSVLKLCLPLQHWLRDVVLQRVIQRVVLYSDTSTGLPRML